MVNNVISQYNQRISMFPADTNYEVVIDVRGQSWSQAMLDDVTNRIRQLSNGEIIVSFITE